MRARGGTSALTEHDRREVDAFSRFLDLAGPPPGQGLIRAHPGWLPYVLGHFLCSGVWGPHTRSLHPPPGWDDVPVTAWTFPG